MSDEQTLITISQDLTPTTKGGYADDLHRSGQVADQYAERAVFPAYQEKRSDNTRARQRHDLQVFSTYLASLEVYRTATDLYEDPYAWSGISKGHIDGFVLWMKNAGYAIGSINVRLSTVRKYCLLAYQAKAISAETYTLIKTISSYSDTEGKNIDQQRAKHGITTRKTGSKKAEPTNVPSSALRKLRKADMSPAANTRRPRADQDRGLHLRDVLLMCLFTEHAFRCSEVASLKIEQIDLEKKTIAIYRSKTDQTDSYHVMPHTYNALCDYLEDQQRKSGPLFKGYRGGHITRQAINARVQEIGNALGIEHLSPHDLRHKWTREALSVKENSLDVIQAYGGWKSPAMLLHYAKTVGQVHSGLVLPE